MRKVSVIIVNWNGASLITQCLRSLVCQSYIPTEIILVDNGSTDGSVSHVRAEFPSMKVVALTENRGFATGNAAGLKVATGEFIALLNNDAHAGEKWLQNLIQPMLEDPRVGISAPKTLSIDGTKIDSAGGGLTTAGVGFNHSHGQNEDACSDPGLIFGGCGAAALYRRRMVDEIGFLDDDFFLYDEDTDLSFRAQLAGWKCAYVPSAVVYHTSNATVGRLSDAHVYHHTRNLEFVWLKNMPAGLMFRFAHHKIFQEIGAFSYLCIRHRKWAPYFRAKRDAIRMFSLMWNKRRVIQRRKRVSNAYLKGLMTPLFSRELILGKLKQFVNG